MATPRPVPTALKLIQGNPGKRAINKSEPKKVAANLRVPGHLDTIAKTQWKKLAGVLDDLGVISQTDLSALEQCVETYARIRRLRIEIKKLGGTAYESIKIDHKGEATGEILWKAYPQVAQLERAETNHKVYLTELGLTPSSRSKIQAIDKADDDDPLAKYNV
jgi:P27 family predicted phage terminase small subunit